jgi:RNA polymerase sigma factor (sigma-70 family)
VTNRVGHGLHKLRRILNKEAATDLRDASLLRCFAAQQDQEAFALLVQRHGPMVAGVCQRVLGNSHDAADAFQAAFLVLARRAAAIRRPQSVAAWLYGVSYRVAAQMKSSAARRRRHEHQAPAAAPTAPVDLAWQELQAALDEEMQCLPHKHRQPLILCFLEGLSQEEAARQLGWPRGTLKRRLERGCDLLRTRLTRRGLTLGASTIAALSAGNALGAVLVPTFGRSLTSAATLFAVRQPLPAGLVSKAVLTLADGVLKTMFIARLKIGSVVLALLAFLALSTAGAVLYGRANDDGVASVDTGVRADPPARQPESPAGKKQPRKGDALGDPLPRGALMRLGSSRLFSGGSAGSTCRFSADGTLLAWTGPHRFLGVYRVKDGKALLCIDKGVENARGQLVPVVEISPDNKYLASQSRSGNTVRLWDIGTGRQTAQIEVPQQVTVLAFSPDGQKLAAGSNQGGIRVFETPSGKELANLKGGLGQVWCALFTGDSKHVWAGDQNDIVKWDLQKNERQTVLKGHTSFVFTLVLSPDGQTLASGSQDHTIRLWDLATGKSRQTLTGHDDGPNVRGVHHLSYLNGAKKLLSVAGDRTVRIWDLATGKNTMQFKTPDMPFLFFTVSPDGKLAAQHRGKFLEVIDLKTGKSTSSVVGHGADVRSVAYSPDGKWVATAGLDRTLRVWDPNTGREMHQFPGSDLPYGSVFFLPDSKTLLGSGSTDPQVHFWDIASGKKIKSMPRVPPEIEFKNSAFFSGTLAVSRDGKLMASASVTRQETILSVMSIETGKPVRTVAGLPGKGFAHGGAVAFTADGKAVVIGSHAHSNLVEVASGKVLHHLPFHADVVAASPRGDLIAVRGNLGLLAGFDQKTGEQIYVVGSPKTGGGSSIFGHALAFSPDGKLLATADGPVIFLREPRTGKILREITGHLDSIQALAFSSDGQRLISGSDDGTALIWDVSAK